MKQVFGRLSLAAFAGLTCSVALAQEFPNRPVRVVITSPAASPSDIFARLTGEQMGKRLGQPFLVDNRPGAQGTIGAGAVVKSVPDGHMLYFGGTSGFHPVMTKTNSIVAGKDLLPISSITLSVYVLATSAKLPVKSFPELLAHSKANPGKLNFGSINIAFELYMKVLQDRTGMSYTVIPYKGSPQAMTALVTGENDLTIGVIQPFISPAKEGTLRVLLAISPRRSVQFPDVPTATELGIPNFDTPSNQGYWAPAGTPRSVIDKLNAAAVAAVRTPEVADQIRRAGSEPVGSTPEEALVAHEGEIRFWTEAVRLANYQPQ